MQPSDRFCTYVYTCMSCHILLQAGHIPRRSLPFPITFVAWYVFFFAFEDTTLEEESQAKEGSDEESSVEDSGHMVYVADQVMTWEEAPKRLATFEG